jgi:hypothetical protein
LQSTKRSFSEAGEAADCREPIMFEFFNRRRGRQKLQRLGVQEFYRRYSSREYRSEVSVFSGEFRLELHHGKYSKWAEDLSEPALEGILWLLGELGVSAKLLMEVLRSHKNEIAFDASWERGMAALAALRHAVSRESISSKPEGRSEMPMFSEEFRRKLQNNTNSKWARNLSRTDLSSILFWLGDLGIRARVFLEVMAKHGEDTAICQQGIAVLSILCHAVSGEFIDVEEAKTRIQLGRTRLEYADLPEFIKVTANSTAPEMKWNDFKRLPDGYSLCGRDSKGRHNTVNITHDGIALVRTLVSETEIPGSVLAALKSCLPRADTFGFNFAAGPDSHRIMYYEFPHVESHYKAFEVLVSADGRTIAVEQEL